MEREERDVFFYFIKIMYWVATVLLNTLSSTVATQASPWIMRRLL
jgi:hypothetical protein